MMDVPVWVALAAWLGGMGYMWTIMRARQRKPVVSVRRRPQYEMGWIVDYIVDDKGEPRQFHYVAAYARRYGGTPIWQGHTDDRGVIVVPRDLRIPASGHLYIAVEGVRDRIQWGPPRMVRA